MDRLIEIIRRFAKVALWATVIILGGSCIIAGINDQNSKFLMISIGLGIFVIGFFVAKLIDWILGQ